MVPVNSKLWVHLWDYIQETLWFRQVTYYYWDSEMYEAMTDVWYRCKRLVESASLPSLCVNQHSWHPTSKDLGIAKTLNNYIAFTNEQDEACTLVVTYTQLSTHSYIHTNYTYIHLNTYTHTHTHIYIHIYVYMYIHTYIRTYMHTYIHARAHVHIHILTYITDMHPIDPLFHHMAFGYEKVTIL